jgi:hypothetical protein
MKNLLKMNYNNKKIIILIAIIIKIIILTLKFIDNYRMYLNHMIYHKLIKIIIILIFNIIRLMNKYLLYLIDYGKIIIKNKKEIIK